MTAPTRNSLRLLLFVTALLLGLERGVNAALFRCVAVAPPPAGEYRARNRSEN